MARLKACCYGPPKGGLVRYGDGPPDGQPASSGLIVEPEGSTVDFDGSPVLSSNCLATSGHNQSMRHVACAWVILSVLKVPANKRARQTTSTTARIASLVSSKM